MNTNAHELKESKSICLIRVHSCSFVAEVVLLDRMTFLWRTL